MEWSAGLTAHYQSKFISGYALNRAWQEIPQSVTLALVDTVRTKILTFALELKDELGYQPETETAIKDIPAQQVERIVNNFIFGGNNVLDGQMTVDARTQVVAGDLKTLRKALGEFGVDSHDLKLLEDALAKDKTDSKAGKIGPKTNHWLSTAVKKVGGSTVKITEGVATTMISGMIKGYLGY